MKRMIRFIGVCIIFLILGIIGTQEISFLSFMIFPFRYLGKFLRYMSLSGIFANVIAVLIFLSITLLPMLVLGFKIVKEKAYPKVDWLLPVLSIALGMTLYYFINPHILYQASHPFLLEHAPLDSLGDLEIILTSGIAYIFYVLLAIYLLSSAYVNKNFDNTRCVKVLLDVIIVISVFSILTVSLSSLIMDFKGNSSAVERSVIVFKYVAQLTTIGLFVYLLELFRTFIIEIDKDGFQDSLLVSLKKISDLSFMFLIITLLFQGAINLYQFIVLDQLMNVQFILDIPIQTILLVSIILIFSRYLTKVIDLRKENELII